MTASIAPIIHSADGESFSLLTSSSPHSQRPIILCLPALGVPARLYLQLLKALNKLDLSAALFELRGVDTSSVRASRRNDFGYHTILEQDLPAAISYLKSEFPDAPLYLMGHSIGAQFAALYASLNPNQANGLIGVATGTPYYRLWPFPLNVGLLAASKLMWLITNSWGHYPGKTFGFAGREARQLINDWVKSVRNGRYQIKGYTQLLDELMAELTTEALFLSIEADRLAPPESASFLGQKLTNASISYQHLKSVDFEHDSTGHFKWMKEPLPVAQQIANWIAEHSQEPKK